MRRACCGHRKKQQGGCARHVSLATAAATHTVNLTVPCPESQSPPHRSRGVSMARCKIGEKANGMMLCCGARGPPKFLDSPKRGGSIRFHGAPRPLAPCRILACWREHEGGAAGGRRSVGCVILASDLAVPVELQKIIEVIALLACGRRYEFCEPLYSPLTSCRCCCCCYTRPPPLLLCAL